MTATTPTGEDANPATSDAQAPRPSGTQRAPGVYANIPAEVYHAEYDWLSVSGAKKLLPPSCPAKFKAQRGVEEHRPQFDLGKAVHKAVLGDGEEVVEIAADSYRSADARAARDAAYAEGKVPLLPAEAEQVRAMAAAVREHPVAAALFSDGTPEVSLFWVDAATGVQCRARVDWMPNKRPGRRLIVPDLKTAVSAEPAEFARAAARFGYVQQHDHYCDGIRALGIDPDPAFVFVVVEKEAPHVVTVGQFIAEDDLRRAAALNRKARLVFNECTTTDQWPGYVDGVADLFLPPWYHSQTEEIVA